MTNINEEAGHLPQTVGPIVPNDGSNCLNVGSVTLRKNKVLIFMEWKYETLNYRILKETGTKIALIFSDIDFSRKIKTIRLK